MNKLTDLGMSTTLAATLFLAVAAFGYNEAPRAQAITPAAAQAAPAAAAAEVTLTSGGRMKLTVTAQRPRAT